MEILRCVQIVQIQNIFCMKESVLSNVLIIPYQLDSSVRNVIKVVWHVKILLRTVLVVMNYRFYLMECALRHVQADLSK